MSSGKPFMTTAEYAAHRGVSDSYVRRMRRDRRLVEREDKLIDVAASDALLDETSDPTRGGDRSAPTEAPAETAAPTAAGAAPEVDPFSLREAMRRERLARARMAELELGETAKQLVRVDQVDRDVFTLARQALERLRSIPSRLRSQLAAETDPRACEALLDAEVAKVCEDLQKSATAMFDRTKEPTPAHREAAA
ncbi:hypothetical protein [Arenimonas oryziterrae]|uniref:Terminase small subunit n=1 Tax=Arenimonas oryziterrae DSM 21050 = YC6267 TaxID=1121015 RepID=A0A091AT35_9GAMM|nr:hypothetical protein [Arenimonas oryziterrae]KFN42327.1 hypothetical protein N789_14140 [Arenimonas oryziterrae DSM 21050 = YC6267]